MRNLGFYIFTMVLVVLFKLANMLSSFRHASLENHVTEQIVGSTDQQPLLETPGEVSVAFLMIFTSALLCFLTLNNIRILFWNHQSLT